MSELFRLALAPLLLLATLFPSISAAQQDEQADALKDRIDAVVRRAGIGEDEPGVAVLVLRGGEEVYNQSHGLADVEAKRTRSRHRRRSSWPPAPSISRAWRRCC